MEEFRKSIIRSSSMTDDKEQNNDCRKIDVAKQLFEELQYVYYGYDASYLPYTHDAIETASGIEYRFNPEAADIFISELINTIDELYWRNYPLPDELFDKFNDDTKNFYRSFLYLAIRIATISIPSTNRQEHHTEVGSGTFKDLLTLAHLIVIPYSESSFHRRFEIGIQDTELPKLFCDIGKICRVLGKENIFLHSYESDEEQTKAFKEDTKKENDHIKMIADENGIDLKQLKASTQYLRETNAFYRKQGDDELRKILGDFEDKEAFFTHASTYRDLLFNYNNFDSEKYIDTALKLFLLRNNLSALSADDFCRESHNQIAEVINNIRNHKYDNNINE